MNNIFFVDEKGEKRRSLTYLFYIALFKLFIYELICECLFIYNIDNKIKMNAHIILCIHKMID